MTGFRSFNDSTSIYSSYTVGHSVGNYKKSSGDKSEREHFTTISHTYFKIPKREPTSFNKLDAS